MTQRHSHASVGSDDEDDFVSRMESGIGPANGEGRKRARNKSSTSRVKRSRLRQGSSDEEVEQPDVLTDEPTLPASEDEDLQDFGFEGDNQSDMGSIVSGNSADSLPSVTSASVTASLQRKRAEVRSLVGRRRRETSDRYAPILNDEERITAQNRRAAFASTASVTADGKAGRPKTSGEQKAANQATLPPFTEEDDDAIFENDNEFMNWVPVPSPSMQEVEIMYGPSVPRAECFGCKSRLNSPAAVQIDVLQRIGKILSDNRQWTSDIGTIETMSQQYDNIRDEHNERVHAFQEGQELSTDLDEYLLPEWSKRSIYDHIQFHHDNTETDICTQSRELKELRLALYNNGIWRMNLKNPKEQRLHLGRLGAYLRVMAAGMKMRSGDSTKMINSSPAMAASARNSGVFLNPGKNTIDSRAMTRAFN